MNTEHDDLSQPDYLEHPTTVATNGTQDEDLRCMAVDLRQIVHNSITNAQAADCIYDRLRQHDAEVRKPLVDALVRIRRRVVPDDPVAYIIELQDLAAVTLAKQ